MHSHIDASLRVVRIITIGCRRRGGGKTRSWTGRHCWPSSGERRRGSCRRSNSGRRWRGSELWKVRRGQGQRFFGLFFKYNLFYLHFFGGGLIFFSLFFFLEYFFITVVTPSLKKMAQEKKRKMSSKHFNRENHPKKDHTKYLNI